MIFVTLAGLAAEARLAGRYNWVGSKRDRDQAVQLAVALFDHPKVASRYVDFAIARTEAFFEFPPEWAAVDALAKRLLQEKTLNSRRARILIKEAREASFQSFDWEIPDSEE